MRPGRCVALLGLTLFVCASVAQAQEEKPQASPSEELAAALVAACRQNEAQFSRSLTADNAAAFERLPAGQRVQFMRRFVLVGEPGRPLLSSDAQGRTVLRCDTSGGTVALRLNGPRLRENLAFIPVDAYAGSPPVAEEDVRQIEFGMVREGGWKLLSVGLLLVNIPELAKQWATADLEAQEDATVAALRRLREAIATYRRAFGALPEQLTQLGPATKEGVSPEAASLVDAELAAGEKGGYRFRYRILPEAGQGGEAGFELAAVPIEYGKGGRRSFFLDSSGVLHGADKHGQVATAADPRVEPR